jgi:hypothetical protein
LGRGRLRLNFPARGSSDVRYLGYLKNVTVTAVKNRSPGRGSGAGGREKRKAGLGDKKEGSEAKGRGREKSRAGGQRRGPGKGAGKKKRQGEK